MPEYSLTLDEIKTNLHELANKDMWAVIVLLKKIREQTSRLTISQSGLEMHENTEQALHLLGNIQSFLQDIK